ncbi:MFS transporter [Pseudonocardia dioxanivorans]|uniref:MFS transporter n=1 Tax=Pseudonocardia dioxanivorans TaxID=240495 RepID=UPI000CD1A04B|nr:MFS transporter [Pseudonocardia dioxanivorans]
MPTARPTPPSARQVALASCVGTTIEFYDFLIYGTAAALVFPKLFFPGLGETAGTVAAFSTFAVAFFARPVGGVIFGHFGDRLGRKRTLTATLLIMGVSTVLIGLLPTAATIGAAAPILLVVLRFLQGFAIGGEWAGAALLASEHAPNSRRGLYAIFPQLGAPFAFILASGTFLITNLTLGETSEAFLAYGWRVPFLLSVVLVGVGLYVRMQIEETPAFVASRTARSASRDRAPIVSVLRDQWREVVIGVAAMTGNFAIFYLGTTFLTSYGTNTETGMGLPRTTVLALGLLGGTVFAVVTAGSALLSDRIGRRTVLIWGNLLCVPIALVLFPLLDLGTGWAFAIGIAVTMGAIGMEWGSIGVLLPELFDSEHRYTGASVCYNVSAILGGGFVPIAATAIAAAAGSFWVGAVVALLCLISWLASRLLPETRGRDLVEGTTGRRPVPEQIPGEQR